MQIVFCIVSSGTLSFSEQSSRYFVVACAVTQDVRGLERVPKKVFRGFLGKEKRKRKGEVLHANKETYHTRKKFLRLIAAHSASEVFALIVEKEKVPEQLRGEKHFLYNHCVERLLDAVIEKQGGSGDVALVASRRETKKRLNVLFAEHIQDRILRNHSSTATITITPPSSDWSLQVADMLAWAVFQKYENRDSQWCDMLGAKGVEERFYS